jgi:hypothetical protein
MQEATCHIPHARHIGITVYVGVRWHQQNDHLSLRWIKPFGDLSRPFYDTLFSQVLGAFSELVLSVPHRRFRLPRVLRIRTNDKSPTPAFVADVGLSFQRCVRYNVLTSTSMDTQSIIDALDREIDRLQQARAILTTLPDSEPSKRGPGRPKSSTVAATPKRRVLSEEARARIAAAQKKRWAAKKKDK